MKPGTTKWILTLVLLLAAAWMVLRTVRSSRPDAELSFFYDLKQQKLFTLSRTNIPPMPGLDGGADGSVRAVVVSTNGNVRDKSSWTIAYLEKYSPELKHQMESARNSGTSPSMGRGQASFHRWVKLTQDQDWVPMNSPEGERIVNRWLMLGPGGSPATVCTPQ